MSAEVHRITPAGPVIGPEPTVVVLLERLLDEAKAGDLKGIGVFAIRSNDDVSTVWESGCASANLMVAGSSTLFHRVNAVALEAT